MMALWAKLGAWGTATAAAGVRAAVVTGGLPLDDVRGWFNPKPQVAVVEETEPQSVAAKPAVPVVVKESAKAKPSLVPPSFDILRVEKNGSVLVAGRAPAGAMVELVDSNGKVVGITRASEAGEFVILPDSDLAPGDHSFTLRATKEGAPAILSAQAGVIRVPERNVEGDDGVLAMVVEGGLPSRIVAKPFEDEIEVAAVEPLPEVATDAVSEAVLPEVEEAKPEPVTPSEAAEEDASPAEEPAAATETEPVEVAKPEIPPVTAEQQSPVAVEAVEVENETVFVAGAVKRGKSVRVYINNEAIGTARGTPDDRFLVKKEFPLEPGSHSVRADVLDPSSGQVTGRAEVPLVQEPLGPEAAPAKEVAKVEQPSEEPEVAAPAGTKLNYVVPIRTGSAIIIKPGDNLWRISRRNYGRGVRYTTIYEANRNQIRDPNRIYSGQII